MSPFAYFILMDFITYRFHIYHGDMNDPASWKYMNESFTSYYEAECWTTDLEQQG